MKKYLAPLFFTLLTFFLLWDVFIKGLVPVPFDILAGHYFPWKDYVWLGLDAGVPLKNFQLFDVVFQIYPWRSFSVEAFMNGEFPLWNPYNLLGTPHLANLPTASLYPLNIIFLVIPFLPAWVLYIGLQTILAGTFMYLFLRSLRLTLLASLFGGTVFAFSSFLMMRYEFGIVGHTFLWVPLALFSIEKWINKFSFKWWLLGVFSLLFMFLGGYFQAMLYGFAVVISYLVYKLFLKRQYKSKSKYLYIIGFLITPLLLASIALLPFVETILNSSRAVGYEATGAIDFLMSPQRLVGFLVPDFFGNPATANFWGEISYTEFAIYAGVIPFIFALYSLLENKDKNVIFWAAIFLISLLLLVNSQLSRLPYVLNIPMLSSLLPSRLTSTINLSIAMLSAYGFSFFHGQLIKKDTSLKRMWYTLAFFGIVFASIWFFVLNAHSLIPDAGFLDNLIISKRNLILPSMIFGSAILVIAAISTTKFRKYYPLGLVVLLLITSFDLIRQARKYNPFVSVSLAFAQTDSLNLIQNQQIPARVMITHQELFPVNTNINYRISMIDGYDSVHSKRTEQLLSVLNLEAVDAKNTNSSRVTFSANESSTAINLLSPEFVYTLDREIDSPRFDLIQSEGRTRLYKNKDTYPRVYLTKDVLVKTKENEILTEVLNLALKGKKDVVLEESVELTDFLLSPESSAEIINYEPNKVKVISNSNSDAILVLNDAFTKDWRVFVNGEESKLHRANYALRAVKVPPGESSVEFIYDPKSFKIGKWVSITTLIFLVGIILYARFRQKRS